MATIELDHLVKRFADGTEAVHEATFTIEDGEFFILVGPSGCGKSTLLNMIVGLEDISGGSLKVDGKEVNDVDPKDRNMAMVFQSYAIYPHLTVRENMEFPLKLRKMGAAEIKQRVDDAAAILELGELLDRKPANLSGGQRQRVAMGRAIVREPEAFLMDEPLSNLDAKLRVQMRTEISRLQRRLATTTVYVTHDQVEAMTLGDRVAVLRKGHVLQVGTPRDLYDDPANLFVAGFIGSPAMNLLPVGEAQGAGGAGEGAPAGQHKDVVRLPMVDVPVEGALAETIRTAKGQVIAGIRPEHIQAADTVDDAIRPHGVTFTATLEVVEWLGAELFVYFDVEGGSSGELDTLAKELENAELGSGDEARVSARISPDAAAREGQDIELWLDARRLHLFDAATGESLRRKAAGRTEPVAPTAAATEGT